MATLNPAVDAYIENAQEFAKPILTHLRKLIHQACPDVVEAIKWSLPHFDYNNDFMFVMSSHKAHCTFTFLKGEEMKDPRVGNWREVKPPQRFMGKLTKFSDLPSDEDLLTLMAEAVAINASGKKKAKPAPKAPTPAVIEVPDYFAAVLCAVQLDAARGHPVQGGRPWLNPVSRSGLFF